MVRPLLRASILASLSLVLAWTAVGQTLSVLHIKVVVIDAERKATPVPRHALLISDNPPSAPPRRVLTSAEGTADVRLRPGSYTVESDRPVAFQGRVYQWTERVEVVAGRDALLELTADNADVEPVGSTSASSLENDPSFLLSQWNASVVAIWTPTTHASGFLVDTNGLIATNQRVIGTATAAEVQLAPELKVMARVLVADPMLDVAILWIDPGVVASIKPLPLGCAQTPRPSVKEGQEVFTIGAPLRGQKGMTFGTVSRVEPRSLVSDLRLAAGSAGGPAFAAGGSLVGITSLGTEEDDIERRRRVVRIDAVCDVLASAREKTKEIAAPSPARLPVEPVRPFPVNTLKEMAKGRAGSLTPPGMSSPDFDVAFITPVLIYAAENLSRQGGTRDRGRGPIGSNSGSDILRAVREFSNWSEYVADFPPVLLVRVTPKLVEGFWTTVARGAAMTQGMALPPIKRVRAGFSRMRAFCGDAEVTPIHPLKLEQRIGETDAIHEGLYVFDPGALGPHCGTVRLELYSDKEPDKGDTRVVDPQTLERIWQDFAPYRALAPGN
jgi:S1-C subfamily serine protease